MLLQMVVPLIVVPHQLLEALNQNDLDPRIVQTVLWGGVGLFLLSLFFLALPIVRLRHPEENQSTPLRTTLLLLWGYCFLTLVAFVINELTTASFHGMTANHLVGPAFFALICCGLSCLFFGLKCPGAIHHVPLLIRPVNVHSCFGKLVYKVWPLLLKYHDEHVAIVI